MNAHSCIPLLRRGTISGPLSVFLSRMALAELWLRGSSASLNGSGARQVSQPWRACASSCGAGPTNKSTAVVVLFQFLVPLWARHALLAAHPVESVGDGGGPAGKPTRVEE